MQRLAIVTQDPAHGGGVLRLVEYICERARSVGVEPVIIHYGRFVDHGSLTVSPLNLLRGELNFSVQSRSYEFRSNSSKEGWAAIAIGARFPEWEPNRLRASAVWKQALSGFDGYILVTGSAHTGLPLAELALPFIAWVSATVAGDRSQRLNDDDTIRGRLEKRSLPKIMSAERRVLSKAQSVFAVSHSAASELAPIAGRPADVWPFPIDTNEMSPNEVTHVMGDIRCVFVGRSNDPRKRIELFLTACKIAAERSNDGRKIIAVVVSSIRPNDVDGCEIEHHADISRQRLIELYRDATAFVLTSEQEGLGIAAMEAMSCGLPVISTRCGGPETYMLAESTGVFVDDHPSAIADAMLRFATNSGLARAMGNAARERIVSNFSEQVWNSKFNGLIERIVGRKKERDELQDN